MSAAVLILRVDIALCVAMLMLGAVVALTSANVVKRVIGALIVNLAAVLAAGALTDGALLIVGVAVLAATLMIGCALLVRLQERYGGVEAFDQDVADADAEPRETGSS